MPQLRRKHQPMPGNEAARKYCKMLVVLSFYGGRFSLLHSTFLLFSPAPGFTLKWKTMSATPHLQVWSLVISTGILLPDTWNASLGVEHCRDLESCYGLKLTCLPRFIDWSPSPPPLCTSECDLICKQEYCRYKAPNSNKTVSLYKGEIWRQRDGENSVWIWRQRLGWCF